MASVTTNYGFDVPTSSDLVKNGATAISTLGQDLDTFLYRPFTRNAIINGSMDIWQRGTSIAAGTSIVYSADRWQVYRQGLVTGLTVSRQSSSLTGIQYCARVQRDSGNTSTAALNFNYQLETIDSYRFANVPVVLSFYARAGANYSAASGNLYAGIRSGTGTDQTQVGGFTGSATVGSTTAALTTSWQRFTITGTPASTATQLGVYFYFDPVGTAGANDYFEITGVQLEMGNQASPFIRAAGGLVQQELAACQRYFETSYNQGTTPADGAGSVSLYNTTAYSTGSSRVSISYKVQKRSAPTVTFYRTTVGASAGKWTFYASGWTDSLTTSVPDANTTGYTAELGKSGGYTVGYSYLASGDWTSSAEL